MNQTEIIEKLKELGSIARRLDLTEEQRTQLVNEASVFANQTVFELDSAKAYTDRLPESLEITNSPASFADLLQTYKDQVVETGIRAASGKHLGYIPAGGIFTAAVADFIAAATNPYVGVYYASPGGAAIENEVINWHKKIFSFPDDAVGNLTSGGSVSTLIAFAAARDKHGVKNEFIRKSVVYMSEQVHHAAQKALRIIGLEDVIIRYVPTDTLFRMQSAALNRMIEDDITEGLRPFMVVTTAGTTDTGSVDPIDDLAGIAEKYKLWFHVDAAYGGYFIMTSKKHLFKGIERADSLIVDPHKGMFIPYGLAVVLIKSQDAVLHSNYYAANYMQDAAGKELVKSPSNVSPELSKHFRGLRMWLPLQYHGLEPFIASLEEKLLLVAYFRNKITELGFETGPEPELSVSYFRYPFKEDAENRNKRLMDEMHADGEVFFSSSVINNQFVIRVAVLSFRTTKETIDRSINMIERCLQKVM